MLNLLTDLTFSAYSYILSPKDAYPPKEGAKEENIFRHIT